jgi:8-oxo-dGTP diphosphatase
MIPVVAALIKKNDNFLIGQRARGELKGYWEFPGGKVEFDETQEEAIVREIEEELGIIVNPKVTLKTFNHNYDFANIELTLIECLFDGVQEINLVDSHEEYQWINTNTTNINFAPLDQKIFEYLKENL